MTSATASVHLSVFPPCHAIPCPILGSRWFAVSAAFSGLPSGARQPQHEVVLPRWSRGRRLSLYGISHGSLSFESYRSGSGCPVPEPLG